MKSPDEIDFWIKTEWTKIHNQLANQPMDSIAVTMAERLLHEVLILRGLAEMDIYRFFVSIERNEHYIGGYVDWYRPMDTHATRCYITPDADGILHLSTKIPDPLRGY